MDELPPNARAALAQLKHAHDRDDPDAKARVGARVATAVGLAGGAAGLGISGKALASAGHTSLWARLAAHKLGAALSVAGVATLGAVTAPELIAPAPSVTPSESRAPAVNTRRGTQAAAGEPSVAAPAQPGLEVEPAIASAPDPTESPTGSGTLPAELALLREADLALVAARPADALALLELHERRFPRAALREERRGLEAIARCQLHAPGAQASAAEFASAYPAALLGRRVKLACAE